MNKSKSIYNRVRSSVVILLICFSYTTYAQQMLVDLSSVDGMDITPQNILNFRVQYLGTDPSDVVVKGTIRYRSSDMSVAYSFRTKLQPGLNSFSSGSVSPQYQFSSSALRELFQDHGVLPYGTYQYCVSVAVAAGGDGGESGSDECLFRKSEDQFMINLIDPEDDAKLYEYNPLLTWVANYSFSSLLTYRIRVAEIKEGQNTASAITRNNSVYQEKGLTQNSIVYPVYGKPLQPYQPYAWTVDAYYKGILLGGAEPWRFTIVEDSVYQALPDVSSYVDLNIDDGSNRYYAVGNIKLKYTENNYLQNELTIRLVRNGKEVKNSEWVWYVKRGANFKSYDLSDLKLKHKGAFEVIVETKKVKSSNSKQTIKYSYVDPVLVK